jgi:membrane protease subunit (stomatin/prohibitin family)
MMIARPDAQKDKVVYKHPDQTFPFWSQLTVDADECAVFFRDGNPIATLAPGRHTLQTQNYPFLNNLVDRFTGGNVFISEIFFVLTRPLYNQGFGDTIGSMRDPELEIRVTPRAFGTFSYRVVDPLRFIVWFRGQSSGDPNDSPRWIQDMLFMGLRSTLTRLLKSGELSLLDLGQCGPDVARSIVQSCPDLQNIGVQVLEVAKLNINLSEEDQSRIDGMQDQIVQANVDAKAAQRRIKQAEAEAAQRQYQLDQDFANRARYMNQLDMGRYQQFAAAEATLGLGQGMAQGGDAAAAGASGAAVASGLGLGAGMAAGARMPMPYGYPPPGYPPPPGYGAPPGLSAASRIRRASRLSRPGLSAAWLSTLPAAGLWPPSTGRLPWRCVSPSLRAAGRGVRLRADPDRARGCPRSRALWRVWRLEPEDSALLRRVRPLALFLSRLSSFHHLVVSTDIGPGASGRHLWRRSSSCWWNLTRKACGYSRSVSKRPASASRRRVTARTPSRRSSCRRPISF